MACFGSVSKVLATAASRVLSYFLIPLFASVYLAILKSRCVRSPVRVPSSDRGALCGAVAHHSVSRRVL